MANKKVTIEKNDKEREVALFESDRSKYNHHLKKGTDGLHFKSEKSVKAYFERRNKGAEISIS